MPDRLALIGDLPVACLARNRAGRIQAINGRALRLLDLGDREPSQLVDTALEEALDAYNQRLWQRADQVCLEEKRSVRFSLRPDNVRPQRVIRVHQHARASDEGEELLIATLEDATASSALESQLAHRKRYEAVLLDLTTEFVNRSTREMARGFNRVLGTVATLLGAAVGVYYTLERVDGRLRRAGMWASADGLPADRQQPAAVSIPDLDPELRELIGDNSDDQGAEPAWSLPEQLVGRRQSWWDAVRDHQASLGSGPVVVCTDETRRGPDWLCEPGAAQVATYPVHTRHELLGVLVFASPEVGMTERYEETLPLMRVVALLFAHVMVRQEIETLLNDYSINLERKVEERTNDLKVAYQTLKQTQSQLLQAGKMASIGQLAAGVAHEINNPVGYVKSNLHSLREYARELQQKLGGAHADLLDEMHEMLDESIEGTRRVDDIVSNLRTFSRMDRGERTLASVNELIETTLTVIRNEIKYTAEVERDFGEVPDIYCSPDRLNQVFVNLLINAAQAIEDRGTIRITTGQDEDTVMVQISDTGRGITAEDQERIFEPFFTTKDVGQGTGLGLSIVYDIVTAHGGTISVDSEPGVGSTFTLALPIQGAPAGSD